MEEIELEDIQGLWLGEEFNLFIGSQRNTNYGHLVDILGRGESSIETKKLQLSASTADNTRMLNFNADYSIEIWSYNLEESTMTITVNGQRYNLRLRPS